jgi:ubiquinone/menaquinone biosynthesis C-methylase UbiE
VADANDPDVEKGFTDVDAQPDATRLVAGMEATAQWPAVRRLRDWERERLAPCADERLLDVGCGMGDMACSYAAAGAHVTAIDASEAMLGAGRERARREGVTVDFQAGDATALAFDDGSFDACRSERVLQWIPDIPRAVGEMVRVVRSGGRLCLTDTDWRTFVIDIPDSQAMRTINNAVIDLRGASALAGGRLLNLCRDAGLTDLDCTAGTHVWHEWDPDTEPNPSGFFPLNTVVAQLVDLDMLEQSVADAFLDQLNASARAGRFFMSLSMISVFGRR